jgi:3'-5' exoribonuclease
MRRLFLRDCAAGDVIEDAFVLTNKQLSNTVGGKYYIKAFVRDRSLQVNARMWNATKDLFNALPDGGIVRIRGRIENYQGNLQFVIDNVWPAKDGSYELGDLVPQTSKDIGQMCRRLQEVLGSIQNRHLAALVQAYLDDDNLMARFCKAPAAMSMHHAFIGGLLEHTLNATEVADAVCPFYPGLNRDVVIAGIFLHDIAKTWELCYDCAFGYTDGGHLVGHIVKSAMWVEEKAKDAEKVLSEPVPRELIDVMQHIILSHHGDVADGFGSARSPSTPEALAVHMIENMDAKLMMALCACRGEGAENAEGNWTEYMKAFSGKLYRPDVAPADAGHAPEPPAPEPHAAAPQPHTTEAPPAPVMKLSITNPLFETAPRHGH